jgi:predicted MPP superfamily phosphohydrolase
MTHLTIPVRKLAWGTDWHLNFLKPPERQEFIERVARTDADAFAISGDFTDGRNLERDLLRLGSAINKPVFLLLGNHDRYHASFAEAEAIVQRAVLQHPQLHRLTGGELVELSPATALLGVDGWADGTAGAGSNSQVELNDTRLIEDLALLPRSMQWLKMRELAAGFAKVIEPTLHEAMSRYAEVIVLTHVPPLPEATWHEGRPSEADFLPHFCNPTLGRLLREVCLKFPEVKLTVLCGHTHGEGRHREGKMTVWTGGAEYFKPEVDRVIEIA